MVLRRRRKFETMETGDDQMLQADVMRFMAIIAFCLLVVFIPLTQILPAKRANNTTVHSPGFPDSTLSAPFKSSSPPAPPDSVGSNTQPSPSSFQAGPPGSTDKSRTSPENPPKPVESPPSTEREQVIKFRSHAALVELIEREDILFVIHTSGVVIEVQHNDRAISFSKVQKFRITSNTYEMPERNVPRQILSSFRRQHANIISREWKFYLDVSGEIGRKLESALRDGKGGDYVIEPTGEVTYED